MILRNWNRRSIDLRMYV